MPEAFVGLGSNVDARRTLTTAAEALKVRFGNVRFSGLYRSAASGQAAPDYLNMAAALTTAASAADLRAEFRTIEAACGRSRVDPTLCELDLDLLLYGASIDATQRLPRPGIFSAPYIVVPLAELRPTLRHPLTGEFCSTAAARVVPRAVERVAPFD